MSERASRWAALCVAGGLALYCALHLQVRTDITAFLPAGSDPVFAALSKHLSDSDLSRTVVLVIGAEPLDAALAGSGRVARRLREHPGVMWVRDGVDPDELERIYQLYFPARHGFLFEDPEQQAAEALSDRGLAERARRLARELARPTSPLVQRTAPSDPLGAFSALLGRLREDERVLDLHGGRFVTPDRRHAVLFFGTRASAYDADAQRQLQDDLAEMLSDAQRASAAPLVVEQSGAGRFAAGIQAGVERDVRRVLLISTSGVALLFLVFFRSLRSLLIALMPLAGGALVAASVGTFWFGTLNGLAVAFGASLVGVSIDYSVHLLNHLALSPSRDVRADTLRRLRPSLLLGGATTLASLIGLGFSNFPGFHQMGLLATAGVGSALWIALRWLPALAQDSRPAAFSAALAASLARLVVGLGRRRRTLAVLATVCGAVGLASLPHVQWLDDLRELTTLDPALIAEEESVRAKVSRLDANRFAVVLAGSWEEALQSNDRLHTALSEQVAAGALEGFRSLHTFLWSAALQRANQQALRNDPQLAKRLDQAFSAEGFAPGAFRPFAESLTAPAPEPLTLERLRASSLATLVGPLAAEAGDRTVVLTYFHGIRDEASVRAATEGVEGAHFFDQRGFVREVYAGYRDRTLWVVATGALAVFALLWLRYRRLRPSVAAFLPSLLVALLLAALAAGLGVRVNIVHLIGLVLVMGMGVDYGIFVVDSHAGAGDVGVTMLSLLLSCLTTIFVFGVLAISGHPVLRALGLTAGAGVTLALCLAPLSLAVLAPGPDAPASRD